MKSSARSALLAIVVASSLTTCEASLPEIVLRIRSDIPLGACGLLTAVQVSVNGAPTQSFPLDGTSALRDLPIEVGVVPGTDPSVPVTASVTAVLANNTRFTTTVTAAFPPAGDVLVAEVFLADRCRFASARSACDAASTCGREGCEPILRPSLPAYAPPVAESPGGGVRLVAPTSGARVASMAPFLRWSAGRTGDGVIVDLCADRGCARPLGEPLRTTARCAAAPRDLPPGVIFWRVRDAAGGRASPVWEFFVPGSMDRPQPRSAGLGVPPEVNGDGYADVVASTPDGAVVTFPGGPAGPAPDRRVDARFLGDPSEVGRGLLASVGDLDGDGYGDIASGATASPPGGAVYVYPGGPAGLSVERAVRLSISGSVRLGVAVAGVDIDCDGYRDLAVGDGAGTVYFLFGGAMATLGQRSMRLTLPTDMIDASVFADAGDVNADGCGDLVIARSARRAGVPSGGAVFVVLGARAAPEPARVVNLAIMDDANTLTDVAGIGDYNNDGYADLAAAAPRYGLHDIAPGGTAYLLYGSAPTNTVDLSPRAEPIVPPSLDVGAVFPYANYPNQIAGAGRRGAERGDGFVALTRAPLARNPGSVEGFSQIRHGAVNLPDVQSVAGVGDTNGDGVDDVVVCTYTRAAAPTTRDVTAIRLVDLSGSGAQPAPLESGPDAFDCRVAGM